MQNKNCGLTVAVETLGCKVNQYETSYFLEVLKQAGYRPVPFRERADIYIIHSCAVTAKAGFQTRQLLRRARRANPDAMVVAAGCYAQLEGESDSGREAGDAHPRKSCEIRPLGVVEPARQL